MCKSYGGKNGNIRQKIAFRKCEIFSAIFCSKCLFFVFVIRTNHFLINIHTCTKGLKFGIYEDYGNYTCAGYPGILGHLKVGPSSK